MADQPLLHPHCPEHEAGVEAAVAKEADDEVLVLVDWIAEAMVRHAISKILATDGTAIGAVSTGSMNPCLQHNLPSWYLDPGPAEVTNEPDPAPG
jgi:hypothetical protein